MSVEYKFPKISLTFLMLANLVPLIGVIFCNWSAATILVLLCFENMIIGILNVPKMALCPILTPAGREAVAKLKPTQRIRSSDSKAVSILGNIVLKILTIPVLSQIYLAFVYTQALVLMAVLNRIPGAFESIQVVGFPIAVPALMVSHGISFFVNFIGRGEFRHTSFMAQAFRPYRRVFVMTFRRRAEHDAGEPCVGTGRAGIP
jgi:hypothetical protein